jgi:hypothetical protein
MSSQAEIFVRILIAIAGFWGAIVAPAWIPAACIVLLALRFPAWEALLIGFVVDLLWLPGGGFHFPLFTIFAIVVVWLMEPIRNQFLIS